MADEIGVLNLTIKDNSDQAAGGLTKLAGALRDVKSSAGGMSVLKDCAETLKRISAAIESGANSYRTLGRLATSLEKVKQAASGFKLPDFSKLENLARTLQDNFNAENGLRRMAEGMEAIKQASQGFKMPNAKDLNKLATFMNGGAGTAGGENSGQNVQEMAGMFAEAKERVVELEQAIISLNGQFTSMFQTFQTGWTAGGGMDKFTQTFEAMNSMRMQHALPEGKGQEDTGFSSLKNEAIEVEGTVTEAYDTMSGRALTAGEAFTEAGSAMNAIIPYGKNLEDSWQRLCDIADRAKKAWMEAHPGWGTGRIDPIVTGTNTFGADVRGENGKYLQDIAIDKIHRGTGLSEGEIRKQIDEIGERAKDARARIQEMIDTLNQPVDPKMNWSQGIDRMMGIGSQPKSAEETESAFMTPMAQQIRDLMDTLNTPLKINYRDVIDQVQGIGAAYKDAADSASAFNTGVSGQIQNIIDTLNRPIDYGNFSQGIDRMFGIGAETNSGFEHYKAMLDLIGEDTPQAESLRQLEPGMADLRQQLDEAGISANSFTEKLVDVDGELKAKKKDSEEAARGFLGLKETFNGLIEKFKTTVIGKLASQFARLAKRMAMRAIIKQVSAAFQEGVENVYRYNEAIGGSFAASMDGAATSMLQMKNSIGAAVAPAIQMLLPLVEQLVNGFIEVANTVNQFMAIMNGQTEWTRAIPYATKAFEDQKKSAKGVHDSMKDLLADWDELNIIQSQNSGGGGGSTGKKQEDYSKMFEQVKTFDSSIVEIADYVKQVVGFVTDHFLEIYGIIKLIKTGIKLTKFSSAFSGVVGNLLSLVAGGLIMKITVDVSSMFTKNFIDTGKDGWLVASFLTSALGSTLAGGVIGKVLGKQMGLVSAGITFALSAGTTFAMAANVEDQAKKSKLDILSMAELGFGAILASAGLAMGGFSILPAIGGGILIAGMTATIKYLVDMDAAARETATDAAKKAFASGSGESSEGKIDPDKYIEALQEELNKITANAKLILQTYLEVPDLKQKFNNVVEQLKGLETVVSGSDSLSKEDVESFKSNWNSVLETLKELDKSTFGTLLTGLNTALGRAVGEAKSKLLELRKEFIKFHKDLDDRNAGYFVEMEDLLDRITKNEYQDEKERQADWDRYNQLSSYFLQREDNGLKAINDAIEQGARLDFSKGEDSVEEAKKYLQSVKGQIDESNRAFDEAIDAVNDSYEYQLSELQAEYNSGLINETEFNYGKSVLDQVLEENLKVLNADKDKATKKIDDAYNILFKTIFDRHTGTQAYWNEIVKPLMLQAQKDGASIPKEYASYFTEGIKGNIDEFDTDVVSDVIMDNLNLSPEQIAEKINDAIVEDLKDSPTDLLGWLTDLFGGSTSRYNDVIDISKQLGFTGFDLLTDELKKRTVEAIRNAYGDNADKILEYLGYDFDLDNEVAGSVGELGEKELSWFTSVKETLQEIGEAKEEAANAVTVPAAKHAAFDDSVKEMYETAKYYMDLIRKEIQKTRDEGANGTPYFAVGGFGGGGQQYMQTRAMGGPVRSGDLVMANENGNFELMGKMGNQPVVANNQQIISGISQGVATANGDVVSELRVLTNLMQRMLQKEFVARAVPGSDWGQHNSRSGAAMDRVTG